MTRYRPGIDPKDSIPRLRLGVFDPATARPELCTFVQEAGLLQNTPTINRLWRSTPTETTPAGTGGENQPLLDRANTDFYNALMKYYRLGEQGPSMSAGTRRALNSFYTNQFQMVGSQINSMVGRYIPAGIRSDLEISGENQYPPEPAELFQRYISTDTKERERYEMGRQIALAIIAGELNANADKIHQKLGLVQRHLLPDIFGPLREKKRVNVFALHDNTTNRAMWISTKPEVEIDTEAATNSHLKRHRRGTYDVEGIGPVEYKPRFKGPPGVVKAVRKALINSQEGKDDLITPIEDVQDIMGMEFIVHNAFSSTDPLVTSLIDRVKTSLKDHLGLTDKNFEIKPFKEGERYKGFFQGQRLMVTFPDMENAQLEFMFHGLGDHLNNTYNVGTPARTGGRKDYQAHAIMEIERDVRVLQLLFPDTYYEEINWDAIIKEETKKTVAALKKGNRVKSSERKFGLIQNLSDHTKSRVILVD